MLYNMRSHLRTVSRNAIKILLKCDKYKIKKRISYNIIIYVGLLLNSKLYVFDAFYTFIIGTREWYYRYAQ